MTSVDIVLPVLNEERVLEHSVRTLREHLNLLTQFDSRIVIADNGSTDDTLPVARWLAATMPGVALLHLKERGRGRALRTAWLISQADVVAYMDVDLSTALDALGPLLELVASGRADVATGSRLAAGASVTRSARRELISHAYNLILRESLGMPVRDAQCGFKALRASVARELLPAIADNDWFFDTELLARAQRAGYNVREIPVRWVEDGDSRVRIVRTALADLSGVRRLRREGVRPAAPVLSRRRTVTAPRLS
ncbi:MAG: dolichyl-phosphate beta-glucosyltransferase [Candidatus Dormibacteria bacterium]